MKNLCKSTIILLVFSYALTSEIYGQSKLSGFEGIWRWNGGNGDTFTIVLTSISGQQKLTGYHSFVRNGITIDNSIPQTPDRTFDSATLTGILDEKGNLFYVIRDVSRHSFYMGKIEILRNHRDRAIFYTTKRERPHLIFEGSKPLPPNRTFPDNMLLSKIK